jgi:hypothetical protein
MILSTDKWDVTFFEKFISIAHRFYQDNPLYIHESLDDYLAMLGPHTCFNRNTTWRAWIIVDAEVVVGRIFASCRQDEYQQFQFLPFGYFEAENQDIANQLFSMIKKYAIELKYSVLRGPIQGSVFNSSRFMTKQTRPLFLGEPLHRPEYLQYFEKAGFQISQKWISGFFDWKARIQGMYSFLTKFKRSPYKKSPTTIRTIDFANWDNELRLFYHLMLDAYSEFSDVEPISFEEFVAWNESLKHLIEAKNCLILEHDGEPLGFILAIHDYRPILAQMSRSDSYWHKLKFLLQQKTHGGALLVNYLGKKRDAEAKVKGVAVRLFKKLAKNNSGFLFTPTVFGFISETSKTLQIVTQRYEICSEYCMYELKI